MIKLALSEIALKISSGLTPLRSVTEFWNSSDIPWVKTEQLGEKYIYDSNEKISFLALERTGLRLNPKNTLSIAMYGEGRTRGSVSILKNEVTTNQACCNIVIDAEKADFEYVYYFLKTQYENLRSLSSGVRKNLNSQDIRNFEITIPNSIETQSQVAKILSDLDAKIELNNKINAELEAMAKLIYDYWFVQFEFPFDFSSTSLNASTQGKPKENVTLSGAEGYKSSGGKMVWNEELKREVPEGWENGTLSDIGDIIGGSTPSKAIDENFCQGIGMPWITPKDLSNNKGKKYITRGEWDVTEKGLKEASLKIMPAGTILLSSRAPIGYLAISRSNVTTNQGFKSFVPKGNFSFEYVFYTVKNLIPEIEANSSGSTFQEVSLSTLKTIKTVLPTTEILNAYNQRIKPIFGQQNVLELQNQKLASLRDWLLPMLMNGQVKVGEVAEELGMVAESKVRYGE